jgi:hypothetical protein
MKALLLGLLLSVSLPVSAFKFTSDFTAGIYWAGFPISATNFASNANEGQVLSSFVSQAVNEWEDSLGKEIWNVNPNVQMGSPFGNAIRWSNNFAAETGFNPDTTLAVTVRYRTGTFFARFEIILNGGNMALRNNTANILYQTILHELGHVIGLDHSEFTNAVMYASLQGNNRLSNDDISGGVAAINETLRRQDIGFVSELARRDGESGSNALACGSVSFIDNGNPPQGGSGLIAIFLGLLIASIPFHARKFLPV